MFQPVSLFVGLRYSRAAKGNAFISFISFFSIAGIALGLMSLITVSSVMNGFEQSLKSAMLDLIPHIQVKNSEQLSSEKRKSLSNHPLVKQVSPYLTCHIANQSRFGGGEVTGTICAIKPCFTTERTGWQFAALTTTKISISHQPLLS